VIPEFGSQKAGFTLGDHFHCGSVFLAKLRWEHSLSKSREFGGMGTKAEGKRDVEGKEGK
jgi:hypothetical protein